MFIYTTPQLAQRVLLNVVRESAVQTLWDPQKHVAPSHLTIIRTLLCSQVLHYYTVQLLTDTQCILNCIIG